MPPKQNISSEDDLDESLKNLNIGSSSKVPDGHNTAETAKPIDDPKKWINWEQILDHGMDTFIDQQVERMRSQENQLDYSYFLNDESQTRLSNTNIKKILKPIVQDAFVKADGYCPFCRRKYFFRIEIKPENTRRQPLEVSCDHINPKTKAIHGGTKFQLTCQQCNMAKANATEIEFRQYLQNVKDFYVDYITDRRIKMFSQLTNEECRKAKQFWIIISKGLMKPDFRSKTPPKPKPWMLPRTDDFLNLAKILGLRDPLTGAKGDWDPTMTNSMRLVFNTYDREHIPPFIVNHPEIHMRFYKLRVFFTLKFTSDARREYTWDQFKDWRETIQTADFDFVQTKSLDD
ncbi:hypothetical protein BC940DRAFT_289700 [Gongronella butleri]|nr:hypothetical protein BC940DRAFT_289700 [Gongronella butleri]